MPSTRLKKKKTDLELLMSVTCLLVPLHMEAEFTLDPNVQLGRYRNVGFQGLAPGCCSFRFKVKCPRSVPSNCHRESRTAFGNGNYGFRVYRVCDLGCRV